MPNASIAEFYFIAAMFILIIVGSVAATYFFVRTYKREMNEKLRRAAKQKNEKLKQETETLEK